MNSTLSTTNISLETKITHLIGKLESTTITNQRLLAECISLKKRYEDSENKLIELERDQDRSNRWLKAHNYLIADYEK